MPLLNELNCTFIITIWEIYVNQVVILKEKFVQTLVLLLSSSNLIEEDEHNKPINFFSFFSYSCERTNNTYKSNFIYKI